MAFMPELSPLKMLLFLSGFAIVGAASLVALHAWYKGKPGRIKVALAVIVGWCALYAVSLLGCSLADAERTLERREWKYYCEIDCHLAYAVDDVRRARMLGADTAQGEYWVVSVIAWFDERTTSPHRPKDMPYEQCCHRAVIVDADGNEYAWNRAIRNPNGRETYEEEPFSRSLIPGESYTTDLVFDLPPDVRNPRLLIESADTIVRAIIGHKASPWHKKIWFALASPG